MGNIILRWVFKIDHTAILPLANLRMSMVTIRGNHQMMYHFISYFQLTASTVYLTSIVLSSLPSHLFGV